MAISKKPMRRSSLLSPWGVGAIVPFPNDESLMIAGLDMWQYNAKEPYLIQDERLQKRLGVKELRWPPDYHDRKADSVNCNLKIPAVRFPRWQYCPFCGTMQYVGLFTKQPLCNAYQWPHGRKCNPNAKFRHRLIPERFVVVCSYGHIDDFPIGEWIHYGSGNTYNPETCVIRRSTGGTSAALTGVRYECSCGVSKSMAGAMRPGALGRMGYTCKGSRPWLGESENIAETEKCHPGELTVIQRGATNSWFGNTKSSIYIPTDDDTITRRIAGIVNDNQILKTIMNHRINGEIDRTYISVIAEMKGVDSDELYDAFANKINNIEGLPEVTESMSEDEYRIAEYKMLIKSSGNDALQFHSVNYSIDKYDRCLHSLFKSISLVHKLRETRAFVGFSRLEPSNSDDIKASKSMLRLGVGEWLPAIEVYGEGVFFEFNTDALEQWSCLSDVTNRIGIMDKAYRKSFFNKHELGDLRPEYVLIHTFAHLIINQLSYECGYGSSSLRERLYCEKCSNNSKMNGVLIYTASGDSEGSLGGLVRQGEPGRLEDTIVSAIHNAEWCSSDPICISSLGQGPDSLNLAACHNCALLPETCCELGNRLLDRGLVLGTTTNPSFGYFSSLRQK